MLTLASIFKKLNQINHCKIISIIAGEGVAKTKLEKMIPNTIFTGYLNHEELSEYYANSDVFIFPSETETIGNVILEALASGLPCIVPDVGFEKIISNYNGFRVSAYSENEYIEKIMMLHHSKKLHLRMKKNARNSVLDISWDHINNQMLNNYLMLTNKQKELPPIKKDSIPNPYIS